MLKDEGYKFMGAAFEVYNQLGFGMAEGVYQQSLEIELALRSAMILRPVNGLESSRLGPRSPA
jgi:GxxExxY protein